LQRRPAHSHRRADRQADSGGAGMRTTLLALVLCCMALAADPPKAAPKASGPSDVQEFVFLGEARPVLVRLHVQSDGKPIEAGWNDLIDYLFGYLDVNKDGFLSKEEAERVPSVDQLLGGGGAARGLGGGRDRPGANAPTGPSLDTLDTDKDGKVSRNELA